MIADSLRHNGPASVTSSRPRSGMLPLGRVLQSVANGLALDPIAENVAGEPSLEDFLQRNERFADPDRLLKLSCPHAIKAWAAERLPTLKVSYEFANRIVNEQIQKNLDEHAALRIVQFADDLTMIACFCREIKQLHIEVDVHSHGLEFRFKLFGAATGSAVQCLEAQAFDALLKSGARENCLKNRVTPAPDRIEASSIVLRKRVRLGFSPVS